MTAQRTLFVGGHLLLLGLVALFAARASNHVLAAMLQPEPAVQATEPGLPEAEPVDRPRSWYASITEEDIFNRPQPEEEEPAEPVQRVSNLKAKLLGTAPGHGMDSYAIIKDESKNKQELYRLGDPFQGRTVARIQWDQVILRQGNQEEILKMATRESEGSTRRTLSSASGGEGIRALDETTYVVDQEKVDESMENLNQLFTQIRAVPHFQDGEADGFRLFAIRRNSVFDQIGLKNGDIIKGVNGNELTDPARAMSLLQKLRDEQRVSVEIVRNREPVTLNYEIR